ncbi:acetyl-CoA sensor PanZ family protein [Endozoicomonadaceae bacterium StTr2]
MPVTMEEVSKPQGQDSEDLVKIYRDAPDWMLGSPEETDREDAVRRMLDITTSTRRIFAARFNDRLLGALMIDVQDDGSWLLHSLCVRKMTRERGVGSRLLKLVAAKAEADTVDLRFRPMDVQQSDWLAQKVEETLH